MEKCCGTIIINEKKVLIVKMKEGHYGFPKGHVEDDESEIQTALRETKEETNLDVEIISDKRYINKYTMPNGIDKEVIFFLAKPITNEINLQVEEISEYIWVPINEITNYFEHKDSFELWESVLPDIKEKE